MVSETQRLMLQTKGVVLGRILIGGLFLVSGLTMLIIQKPAGVAGYFGGLELPVPLLLAWLVIAVKVIAGGLVVIGRHVGAAAGALFIFTALTILIAHRDVADVNLFKNLAIMGGLLYVAAFGAGRWSA